jgi:ribosomal protein S18 acetylase RimI-like enzyme
MTDIAIQRYDPARLENIVGLSLRAWAPVFASIEQAMDPEVFRLQTPDWRASQRAAVEAVCAAADAEVWVAVAEGRTAGFCALRCHQGESIGEIYMIAVDPDFQRRGVGAELVRHGLARLKASGMTTAMVETGGDPGHAPARRVYEAAGFRLFPVAKYFMKL